jgi:hypothetical protein
MRLKKNVFGVTLSLFCVGTESSCEYSFALHVF